MEEAEDSEKTDSIGLSSQDIALIEMLDEGSLVLYDDRENVVDVLTKGDPDYNLWKGAYYARLRNGKEISAPTDLGDAGCCSGD